MMINWGGRVRDGGDGSIGVDGAVAGRDRADAIATVLLGEHLPAFGPDRFWCAQGEFGGKGDSAGWSGRLGPFHGQHEGAGFRADDIHIRTQFEEYLVFQGDGADGFFVWCCFMPSDGLAGGPRRSASDLAAERIGNSFSIADFGRHAGDRDEGLEDGVHQDPADFAGIGTRDGCLFLQCPYLLEAEVFSHKTTLCYLRVRRIGRSSESVRGRDPALKIDVPGAKDVEFAECFTSREGGGDLRDQWEWVWE